MTGDGNWKCHVCGAVVPLARLVVFEGNYYCGCHAPRLWFERANKALEACAGVEDKDLTPGILEQLMSPLISSREPGPLRDFDETLSRIARETDDST